MTYEATRDVMRDLRDLVEGQGGQLIVMVAPAPQDLNRESANYRRFERLAAELGLAVMDFTAELRPADYTPLPDDHWNNEGHAKAAQALEACLRAMRETSELCPQAVVASP